MANTKTSFVHEPGERTVTVARTFAAPPDLVFDIMSMPEHIRKWYGAGEITVFQCESDLREGGTYRIVLRGPKGVEFGFRGVHRQLRRPHCREYTWIFEPMPDKEAVVTETFENKDGTTVFTSTLQFATVEDRDGYLATGATEGGAAALDRVEDLLADCVKAQANPPGLVSLR